MLTAGKETSLKSAMFPYWTNINQDNVSLLDSIDTRSCKRQLAEDQMCFQLETKC